ncbi:glycosyl transferase family 1 [Eilatimonas milleporae]|uniref:Glycosyl transferase family 1 n=2 Tax=Eilatimonas milleporae TaxID=911205 RepID=A0A3M0CFS4_9PROT|nr:glycosyl transferase family 1 [Eilatimonas milleporae]
MNICFHAFAKTMLDVRTIQPVKAMRQMGANVFYAEETRPLPRLTDPSEPRILILQRLVPEPRNWIAALCSAWRKGWVTIVEDDDHPDLYARSLGKNAHVVTAFSARTAHAMQTATQALAAWHRRNTPYVTAFENQVYELPPLETRPDDHVRLFFGAINREACWRPLIDTINDTLRRHSHVVPVVVHDRDFFQALDSPGKQFHPAMTHEDYMTLLATCDISLLPLSDNRGNRCKSDLKFIEAAAAGNAVIASPTVYDASVKDGRTGLIAGTTEDWCRHLEALISTPAYRRTMGMAARTYVARERMLMQHIGKRLAWYRQVWDNRADLHAALEAREPRVARLGARQSARRMP